MQKTASLSFLGLIRRNLFRQPLRSTLTVLGVALGVVAIVAMGALVQGVNNSIEKGLKLGGADLTIFQAGVSADLFSSLDETETRRKLLSDPDILHVAAGMSYVMPVADQRFTIILGVEPDGFTYSSTYVDGPPIRAADECSLGAMAARTLKKQKGDSIEIGGRTFRVVSIFNSGVVIYDAAITVRLDVLQELTGRPGRATAFFVDLRDGADVKRVAERLERAHPEMTTISNASEYHKVDVGLETSQKAVWAITLAAIILGSVIVLNTMWMSVLERTREIGLLRAVGWSRQRVIQIVLLESVCVGLAASVVGIALGVLLARSVVLLPMLSQVLQPSFAPTQFGLAAAAAVLLSVIGGALPALRAARISPAEALRHE